MSNLAHEALAYLRSAGREIRPGLTDAELHQIEGAFGFVFGPDHRALLQAGLPVGDKWCDWRDGDSADLQRRVDWPMEGALFDVEHNSFWPSSWGERPKHDTDAREVASRELARWPKLVPIRAHHCMPAAPSATGAPVFSVWQTDVIYFGANLLDYVKHLYGPRIDGYSATVDYSSTAFAPWSLLASNIQVD